MNQPVQQAQVQTVRKMYKKGYFILFGAPGGGKSFAASHTFQNSLSILSAPNNQHFYEQWLESEKGRASGKRPPKRVIVLDRYAMSDSWIAPGEFGSIDRPKVVLGPDGMPVPYPQKITLEGMLMAVARRALMEAAQGIPLTYQNVIIDEAGTFWARIFTEIGATTFNKDGKLDTLKAYNVGEVWSREIVDLLRALVLARINVCIVAHDKEPEPDKDKQGGPKFFSQAVMKQMCADSDGTFYRFVEQPVATVDLSTDPAKIAQLLAEAKSRPPQRMWRVYISKDWQSKFRGIPDEMIDQIRHMELEQIIPFGGFAP